MTKFERFVLKLLVTLFILGGISGYFAVHVVSKQIDLWKAEQNCINKYTARGIDPNNIKRTEGSCEVHIYKPIQESK